MRIWGVVGLALGEDLGVVGLALGEDLGGCRASSR